MIRKTVAAGLEAGSARRSFSRLPGFIRSLVTDTGHRLALLSAFLFSLSYPPLPLGFLAYFCLVPLMMATAQKGFRTGFRLGYVFGLFQSLILLYWVGIGVKTYVLATGGGGGVWTGFLLSWVAVPLITLTVAAIQALYTGLMAGCFGWLSGGGGIWLFSFPVLWTAMEYSRSLTQLAFPWVELAYTQSRMIPMIQSASWWGHLGVGFALAVVNLLFYLARERWRGSGHGAARPLAAGAAILLLMLLHGLSVDYYAKGEEVDVALVQHNLSMEEKYGDRSDETRRDLIRMGLLWGRNSDLVVFPELTLQYPLREVADGATWTTLARTLESALLMGTIEKETRDGEVCTFNSAVQVGPGGEVERTKYKRMLVPFSERTPYSRQLPFLSGLRIGGTDHCRGDSITVFRLSSTAYSTMICYEVAFASLNREAVLQGAEFLVAIMNNSWWGRSSIIWQHSCIVPFRSVENRRWYACCSNSGFSFFCDPMGRMLGCTDLFTRTGTRLSIRSNDDITFYTRYGKWLELTAPLAVLILLLLKAVLMFADRRRGRDLKSSDH